VQQQAATELAQTKQQAATELAQTKQQAATELAQTKQQAATELAQTKQQAATELAQTKQQAATELAGVVQHAAAMEAAWQAAVQRAETLQTQLIESRGEVIKRDARIHGLEQIRAELEMIKRSRSWRWTRLLRLVTRTIQHRGFSQEDRRKLMRLPPGPAMVVSAGTAPSSEAIHAHEMATVHAHEVATVKDEHPRSVQILLAQPLQRQRDFFVWAVIDWHFRIQRPQHLARELAAAGHRVFYMSNHFIDHAEPGYSIEPLDGEGRLFQIRLHVQGSPAIYQAAPDAKARSQLRASIGMLLAWTQSRACASLVQHPYWLETARILPNQRIVYDCMDHHGGFADNSDEVLSREHELMRDADLLVVTSDWLHTEAGKYNPHRMMIRNACQYEHFAMRPERVFADTRGRKVIGYYGAIAEWFDLELLEKVARRFSDCLVLMVGADTCGARQRLQSLDNVEFTGEVPYASLPYYLEGFDVCLLPFHVIPLTLATNPVKVYEYLSAGKEVVSIALPEIRQFGDLVRTGTDHATFLDAVGSALQTEPDASEIARRRTFAAEQTWTHRVHDLVQGVETLSEPRVSVIVVTYNNLDLTKACLHSLEAYSDYSNLEVIVVDNASADDTPTFMRAWAEQGNDRRIVLNADNRGFAAANNQGLALATGDYLVMLNNDTYVTPGWIATLVGHLRHSEKLGMLGPVTNNIGNEARIEIQYDDMDEMLEVAADYTLRHAGQLTPLRTAAFFCVMLRRALYEKVGPLDEAFGIGFFEDDDYCRRVEQAGWTIACADDVFVHHNLSASFNKLKQETRQLLFERNKATYEAKWGAWIPHRYRDS
jgi:GT2 family glycosyltransferase